MKKYHIQQKQLLLLLGLVLSFTINACSKCENQLLQKVAPTENDKAPTEKKDKPGVIINIVSCCNQNLVGNHASIIFKLTHDPACIIDKDKLQVRITTAVEPIECATKINISEHIQSFGGGAFIHNELLARENIVFDKEIRLEIVGAPSVVKADIHLQLLYEGKDLENKESKQRFTWEPINNVTEELHKTIKYDTLNIVKIQELIANHKDTIQPNAVNSSGESLLWATTNTFSVFNYNDPAVIKELLQIPCIDVNAEKEGSSFSFLELMIRDYQDNLEVLDVIELLLAKGAVTNPGTTMLHAMLQGILSQTCDANTAQKKKLTYIVTTYPALINAKDKDGNTPLHLLAPRCGHNVLKAINLLLKKGAELNINLNIKNNDNKTPIELAQKNYRGRGPNSLNSLDAFNGTYPTSF